MPATYEPIATYTIPSATNTYTFTSITGTYTDIEIVMNGTVSADGRDPSIRFNSDTGTNYSYTNLSGNGTSALSSRVSNNTYIQMTTNASWSSTVPCNTLVRIQNYSNATTFKTTLNRSNAAGYAGVDATVGLWRSTSAITSITLFLPSGNWNTGSTFTLYGIKAA